MSNKQPHTLCPAECSECAAGAGELEIGRHLDQVSAGGSPAMAAATYFLPPLVLACVGAAAGGTGQAAQLVGGVAGFGTGMVLAALLARLRHPRDQEEAWLKH